MILMVPMVCDQGNRFGLVKGGREVGFEMGRQVGVDLLVTMG